jgi:hypothetical protein
VGLGKIRRRVGLGLRGFVHQFGFGDTLHINFS